MSSAITISLFCQGRQKDYKAVFSDHGSAFEFNVVINDNTVTFEGGMNRNFMVKSNSDEATSAQTDAAVLEAVKQQLNQIFW